MTEKKPAVIIGAGKGGITTAVYLSKNRYYVKVFEKTQMAWIAYPRQRCELFASSANVNPRQR